jgi:uncharacterized protein YecT (DUF1311 family)
LKQLLNSDTAWMPFRDKRLLLCPLKQLLNSDTAWMPFRDHGPIFEAR